MSSAQEQPEKATIYQSVMNTIGLGHKKPEATNVTETDKTSSDYPSQSLNDNSGTPGGGYLSAPIPTDLVSGAGTGAVPPLTDTQNTESYGDLNTTGGIGGGESRYGNDIYASGPQSLGGTAATNSTTTGGFGTGGKTVGFEDGIAGGGTNVTRSDSSSSSSSDEEEETDEKPTAKDKIKKVTDKVKEKMCMGGPA